MLSSAPDACADDRSAARRGVKQIVYCSPRRGEAGAAAPLAIAARCERLSDTDPPVLRYDGQLLSCFTAEDERGLLSRLAERYVHLLVVDLRWAPESGESWMAWVEAGHALLDSLERSDDIEQRYGFHRILALVSGPDADAVDDLIARLGARGIGRVLRQREEELETDFSGRVLRAILSTIADRPVGKRALCASGGGVTGIYFELGVLKCLDDCLVGATVGDFDLYFGISAGAVVSGLLAAGYSVDEIMASIAGVPGGRIPPMTLRLLRLSYLNYADIRRRLAVGLKSVAGDLRDFLTGRESPSFDGLLLEYGDLVGAPFRSDRLEAVLRNLLMHDGMDNDFRRLPRPLFIGASDQDARRHVLFGDEEHVHVPVSRAIQASLSVNPAFEAVAIDGRYYEDGAVTRTSDFVEAIRRGADLLFIIDPFVPYVSRETGMVQKRGILYNIDQDLRTLSYTRYESTRHWVLRRHPEVSSYTFLPSNRIRRVLGVNPLDHRPYLEIWQGAYLSTLQRLRQVCHRLRGDLIMHGIRLESERAESVAARLEATSSPTFADFFPEGRVDIRARGARS